MSKTVLVTGASSGIGKETINYFSDKGYEVIGLSRKEPDQTNFKYYECDLSNMDSIKTTITLIMTDYIKIDILVNSAGVGTGGAIEDIDIDELKWVYDVNLFGLIELTRGLLPLLRRSDNPKIVNVGSVAGEITIPYQTSYSMSKKSVQSFTEGLRIELKSQNIDVCTVLPGDTKTGFTSNRKTIIKDDSLYKNDVNKSIKKMEKDEQNGVHPIKVAKIIYKMTNKKRMPVSKIVGLDYKILVFLSKILPKKLVEYIVVKMYG